jgi:glutamine synthetase
LFLVSFFDPDTKKPVSACPRGLLKAQLEKFEGEGYGAMAGGEDLLSALVISLC